MVGTDPGVQPIELGHRRARFNTDEKASKVVPRSEGITSAQQITVQTAVGDGAILQGRAAKSSVLPGSDAGRQEPGQPDDRL
jgi:hypothetical protein